MLFDWCVSLSGNSRNRLFRVMKLARNLIISLYNLPMIPVGCVRSCFWAVCSWFINCIK